MLKALKSQIVLAPGDEDGIDTSDASADTGISLPNNAGSTATLATDAALGLDQSVLNDDPSAPVFATQDAPAKPKAKIADDAGEDDDAGDDEDEFDVDSFLGQAEELDDTEPNPDAKADAKSQGKPDEKATEKPADPNQSPADPDDVSDDDVSELMSFLDIADDSYPGAAKAMKAAVESAKQVKTLKAELSAAQQAMMQIANYVTMQTFMPVMEEFGQRMPRNPFKGSKGIANAREIYARAGELREADQKARRKVHPCRALHRVGNLRQARVSRRTQSPRQHQPHSASQHR